MHCRVCALSYFSGISVLGLNEARNFDHVVDERAGAGDRLIGVIDKLIDGLRDEAGFLSTKARCGRCSSVLPEAKFDSFLSYDCARVESVGAQSKERKESNFAA